MLIFFSNRCFVVEYETFVIAVVSRLYPFLGKQCLAYGFLCRFYGERKNMKEVFQEYGGVIVTIIAIVSLIGVISAVIGTGEEGIIGTAFTELIESFFEQSGVSLGTET